MTSITAQEEDQSAGVLSEFGIHIRLQKLALLDEKEKVVNIRDYFNQCT